MKATSSQILQNVLGVVIAVLLGFVINTLNGQDEDMEKHAVLPYHGSIGVELSGLKEQVVGLRRDFENMRNGNSYYGDE